MSSSSNSSQSSLPRCWWRRSGSLPDAKDLWVRQGTVATEQVRWSIDSSLPERARWTNTDRISHHIHAARSLEHLRRLSMISGESLSVPVATTDVGSSFHVGGGRDHLMHYDYLDRSQQMFSHLALRGTDYPMSQASGPSEIEF
ncbi:hypothetical protein H257_07541 [Aphanomyces astaci]|uniref:Uncharacterized protein n=1 Tax=Aphanomyces astaci TaxID=112090 RepID=W4GG72_APHAT|nr:hypothetical protein H257_07541 [Aphanomyces astaci]ETV78687.1 hypothetical protein H257_07541 [Aphanomyces astaci]|eukprot:XP_009831406.1 hypothetical protein H257_07541 [Aphanomyces astaci]